MIKHYHFWHIVSRSPWPFLLSMCLISLPIGLVTFFQGYYNGLILFFIGFLSVLFIIILWFKDIIIEGTFEGCHTKQVQKSLIIGFILFIFSEIMFFISFFWAFFHSSLFPSIEIGLSWPPINMSTILLNPLGIPLLNTLLLLFSGITLTLGHLFLRKGLWFETIICLVLTIGLGETFLGFQFIEYILAGFDISDGIYGSTFFLCTGFHGLHVLIGYIFLSIIEFRTYICHFSKFHHIGFLCAAWYWHFVDVIWLFLYVSIYYYGDNLVYSIFLNNSNTLFDLV